MKQIDDYLASPEIQALAQTTQDSYGYALAQLDAFCQRRGIQDFTGFQEYMPAMANFLVSTKLSGKSIQQYLTAIKIFLKRIGHPVEYSYRISNHEIKKNKLKHMQRWLNENDIAKCLAYEFPNETKKNRLTYRVIVRLLIETGARVRELANMKIENIDLEDMVAWIHDSKTVPRPVFFSPTTRDMLEKMLDKYEPQENVFPDVSKIKAVITDMLKVLGLKNGKDGRGPHTFRHWFCTKLFYAGVRLEDIATVAGDTPETITNCYLHPSACMLRERISKGFGWKEF
uniref:Putative site-specific tyrosine recombinase n=1 Tax=viral metagenome TaxID=1070528 RepID=A0A6H1Z8M6_9ZZZZ